MKKAIYIHRSPDSKELINIIMEPWPEGGLSKEEIETEAREVSLWLTGHIPGIVFDRIISSIDWNIRSYARSLINTINLSTWEEIPLPVIKATKSLEMYLNREPKISEGEGIEDRLYKTAVYLLDYFERYGENNFRRHFGSLDILESARKIVAEGEGNPHPWE